jgi:glucose-6-phosphate isomerase
MKNLIESPLWPALKADHETLKKTDVTDLFSANPSRFDDFSVKSSGILLDYSRHRMTKTTLGLLADLASMANLSAQFQALFTGKPVNTTENRPALHTALRDASKKPLTVSGENIQTTVENEQIRLFAFAEAVRLGQFVSASGKAITDIVNIGIGGSHLGPYLTTTALKDFANTKLRFHFLSSIDKAPLNDVITSTNPETTLYIVSSKSFTTLETLTNANSLKAYLQSQGHTDIFPKQWVAITAHPDKALAYGFPPEHIFETFSWVGGRYSIWSSVGLPLALMIGERGFRDFLSGAHSMDEHVKNTPPEKNMAMLLALLSFWHAHFDQATAEAVAPYSQRLQALVPYLQQAAMESLGKSVNLNGDTLTAHAGPVLFGQEGSEGQHAYHQFLHQGTLCIPVDFILIGRPHEKHNGHHHCMLLASALSQAEALTQGLSTADIQAKHPHLTKAQAAHLVLPGNRPCNLLLLDELTPATLGALLALYEHKIYAQSVLANINPFDQWGVELGKQLLPDILTALEAPTNPNEPSSLLTHLKKLRGS